MLAATRELAADAGTAGGGVVTQISEMLGCVERCGGVVLQSMAVLSSGCVPQSDGEREAVMGALEVLRELPREGLASTDVSVDEVLVLGRVGLNFGT